MSELVYGIHAVKAAIENNLNNFLDVFILKERSYDRRVKSLINKINNKGAFVHIVDRQFLAKITKDAVHQGIVARVQISRKNQENNLSTLILKQNTPLLLVLDRVTDPRNFGACLRCADAAGVHAVIVSCNHTAPINATVKKVASGAAEVVPIIRVTNLVRTLRFIQEHKIWIIGTVMNMNHYFYQSNFNQPVALVIGSEDNGIRRLTREYCDELISIPMAGTVSSLNVSVAAGICLFEAVRQRS